MSDPDVRERIAALIFPKPRSLEFFGSKMNVSPQVAARDANVTVGTGSGAGAISGAYALRIDEHAITIDAADAAGAAYARTTLAQIVQLAHTAAASAATLPTLVIRDEPDFARRGILLDVSRGKVPTMETLFALIDRFASWKVNELQLYTEHTFAYRGHEAVWRDASPLTPDEVRALDAACRARFIDLVPNQQSFGHMHRWLIHEPYRALAERPDGIDHPFSLRREPYSLCPTDDGSLALIAGLYDQLLPNFTSAQLNVGLDETFDLGTGRSAELCARIGTDRVYVDYLRKIHALAAERGRVMQFWSDVIHKSPARLAEIPRDAVVLDWGYEADHPFDERARTLAASGLAYYVCPGTSAWNSFAGRTQNALANIASAAAAGRAHGALGYLVTDWGDCGHLQPLAASAVGFLAGAGRAWNASDERLADARIAPLLDAHVFHDDAGVTGRAAFDLGNIYRHAGPHTVNGSALFYLLVRADESLDSKRLAGVNAAGLESALAEIEAIRASLAYARLSRADASGVLAEFEWSCALMSLGARIGAARLRASASDRVATRDAAVGAIPKAGRVALAAELAALLDRHGAVWLARNRPGGQRDSRAWLERTLALISA
ncbi:MAG: beta-N-acetylhexosaminidase [bacterium]